MSNDEAEGPEKPPGRRHANVQAAKLAVMEDVAYIQKRIEVAVGGGGKYKAAGAEDFIAAIRPAMVEHGLTITPVHVEQIHRDRYSSKSGADWDRVTLRVRYRLSHAASGTFEEGEAFGEGACNSDKAVQKGMTSTYKYFVRQTYMLETGEDDPDRVHVEAVDKEKRKAYQEERCADAKKHLRRMFNERRPSDAAVQSFLNGLIVALEKDQLTRRMVKDLRRELERRQAAATIDATTAPAMPSESSAATKAEPRTSRAVEAKLAPTAEAGAPPQGEPHPAPAAATGPTPKSDEAGEAGPKGEASDSTNDQPSAAPANDDRPEVESTPAAERIEVDTAADAEAVVAVESRPAARQPEPKSDVELALEGFDHAEFVKAARLMLDQCSKVEADEILELADFAVNNSRLDGPEFGEVHRMVECVRAGGRPSGVKKPPEPKAEPASKKDAPAGKKSGPTSDRDVEATFVEELDAASTAASYERFQALFNRTRSFAQANPKRTALCKRLFVNLGSELKRLMASGKVEHDPFADLTNRVTTFFKTL